ncbi:tetratricopeptide repeat protein [Segetibacter sp. 3557_3]|nr:tetratricopeptide repeat protein [Segetibacter sp. 3557_3]
MVLFTMLVIGCHQKASAPTKAELSAIGLKTGDIISCGGNEFGTVRFSISCSERQADFELALKLLHSFEYDEAEKAFAAIIRMEPGCAMAYWGVAMANFHPIWAPPTADELAKGARALKIARQIAGKTQKEADYISAIGTFYDDWSTLDHYSRCLKFEAAMEKLYTTYPNDIEAALFYSLALNAAASPSDKAFTRQRKAGAILDKLYDIEPNHPGVVHYIIHSYDSPELAARALLAARKYAAVAPSSAHALHMPSHIFTRLGLWEDCIKSNLAAVASAKCYADANGMKGHWDEEIHGLDYLVYGYLQKGDNEAAQRQLAYLKTINEVQPVTFKVAYAFAAIPSRLLLENKRWREAAQLKVHNANIVWKNFPWQNAIIQFTRAMGAIHTGDLARAKAGLQNLHTLHAALIEQKDPYKANQVMIQIKTAEAWLRCKEGKRTEAIALMELAADMEDSTEKHPTTPGEVLPARELCADLYLQLNKADKALKAYEQDLEKHPNRFNALYGAGVAAEQSGESDKAAAYYQKLIETVGPGNKERPELTNARRFLKRNLG